MDHAGAGQNMVAPRAVSPTEEARHAILERRDLASHEFDAYRQELAQRIDSAHAELEELQTNRSTVSDAFDHAISLVQLRLTSLQVAVDSIDKSLGDVPPQPTMARRDFGGIPG